MKRQNPERNLQMAIMQHLRVIAPNVEAIHIPNGGYRRKVEAAMLKGMGVKAGCPDILLLWKPAKMAFIELKAPIRRKNTSDAQDAFLARLADLQIPNGIATSIEEVISLLKQWGAPVRVV